MINEDYNEFGNWLKTISFTEDERERIMELIRNGKFELGGMVENTQRMAIISALCNGIPVNSKKEERH